jgi:hypothetical protein
MTSERGWVADQPPHRSRGTLRGSSSGSDLAPSSGLGNIRRRLSRSERLPRLVRRLSRSLPALALPLRRVVTSQGSRRAALGSLLDRELARAIRGDADAYLRCNCASLFRCKRLARAGAA